VEHDAISNNSRGLFEPDVLGPAQFFDNFRRQNDGLECEQLLMLAVLEDGIACYQRYAGSRDSYGRQLFEEANEWLRSSDQSALFSFESICDVLGIDPGYLRRGLRQWRERFGQLPRRYDMKLMPRTRVRPSGSARRSIREPRPPRIRRKNRPETLSRVVSE
jgi:hypothetical protein